MVVKGWYSITPVQGPGVMQFHVTEAPLTQQACDAPASESRAPPRTQASCSCLFQSVCCQASGLAEPLSPLELGQIPLCTE